MMDTKAQITGTLTSGLHRFSYRTADGAIRPAIGTLDASLMPERQPGDPDKPARPEPEDVIRYWDHEKAGFRQFKVGAVVDMPEPFTPPEAA